METAALLTVGRLRGMKCASVLNNVVRWKECISHGVGSYAAGADAAAAREQGKEQQRAEKKGKRSFHLPSPRSFIWGL